MTLTLQPLLDQLGRTSGPSLWLADENNAGMMDALAQDRADVVLITNRYDIARTAKRLGIQAHFSDFDFNFLQTLPEQQRPRNIFYRVSKERAVTNHLINSSYKLLPPGGQLWLSGQKSEGIKTYFSQAGELFAHSTKPHKQGNIYCGGLTKNRSDGLLLNDNHYSTPRWVETANCPAFISKPGTYGWDKIDKGSAFLLEQFQAVSQDMDMSTRRFLDLGCGYGYITLQCRSLGFKSMTATDNNAAAIACMQANAAHFAIPVQVIADDCASQITDSFDIIACNPPFHQGFSIDTSLTDKFLANSWRLLADGGRAYFVVNAFIPLEAKAQQLMAGKDVDGISVLANNKQFKVIEIRKKKK